VNSREFWRERPLLVFFQVPVSFRTILVDSLSEDARPFGSRDPSEAFTEQQLDLAGTSQKVISVGILNRRGGSRKPVEEND
jgi:hypothetical protein